MPPARGAGLFFEDITVAAGTSGPVDFGGHGVMFAEVDNDSDPDYYLTNSLEGNSDRQDFFFDNTNGSVFAEAAVARGIDDTDGGSEGAVWADLDNDGLGVFTRNTAPAITATATSILQSLPRIRGIGWFATTSTPVTGSG